ncbi:hypothetical protein Vau01_041090 [Virgisporangium aurantiacum]|uniref:Uncharacterized protein n=1 Tax=Virgisporangium aurantiacum TaxID=175570 RepID=A0A8J4E0D5_9ACTN|nr:hypothetical protein Vau01_041090 [Virgisporangium aurantiacum]
MRQGRAPVVFVPTRYVPVARPRPLSTDHATLPDTEERTEPPHPARPPPGAGPHNRTWVARAFPVGRRGKADRHRSPL